MKYLFGAANELFGAETTPAFRYNPLLKINALVITYRDGIDVVCLQNNAQCVTGLLDLPYCAF